MGSVKPGQPDTDRSGFVIPGKEGELGMCMEGHKRGLGGLSQKECSWKHQLEKKKVLPSRYQLPAVEVLDESVEKKVFASSNKEESDFFLLLFFYFIFLAESGIMRFGLALGWCCGGDHRWQRGLTPPWLFWAWPGG